MGSTTGPSGRTGLLAAASALLLLGGCGGVGGPAGRPTEAPAARKEVAAPGGPVAAAEVEPEAPATRRLLLPASVLARLPDPDRASDRLDVEVWTVEEAPEDPSGVRVVGPLPAQSANDGCASVLVRGRVLRWWVRSGAYWYRGEAAADATGATAVQGVGEWGPQGLLRVLDAAGRSVAGVDVTLQLSEVLWRRTLATVRTDADGLALCRLPDTSLSSRLPAPRADAMCFRVEIPVVPPVTASYHGDGPWPAVIRLPPLGAVELRLRSAGDARLAGQVRLEPLVEGGQLTGSVPSVVALVSGSVVRFPYVGTGLRFAATCLPADARVTTRVEFAGPRSRGTTAVVALPFGDLRPVFTGRLLREGGGPVQPKHFWVSASIPSAGTPGRERAYGSRPPGPDGRFEVPLDADLTAAGLVELTVVADGEELLRRRIGAVAPGARVDLGDLRVADVPDAGAVPLLVAGRVLDVDGSPAANVPLTVWRRRRESWRPASSFVSAADGTFEDRRTAAPGEAWHVRPTFDPDGTGRTADPLPFEPGDGDVTLRLRLAGSVSVRLLLPHELGEGHGLWLTLEGDVAGAEPRFAGPGADLGGSTDRARPFGFGGLPAGAGRVVVHPPGLPEKVLASREVVVETGQATDAGTIDLRALVPVRTVRVLGADGKGAADGAVWWRTSDATSRWNPWHGVACRPDGSASIPGMTPVDLLARRAGSGYAEARRVTTDTSLTPPPPGRPTVVEVRLADGLEVPAPPFRLALTLALVEDRSALFGDDSDPRNLGRPTGHMDRGTRHVRFSVAESGRHVARLTLQRVRPDGSGYGVGLELEGDASADVVAGGAPRTIVFRYTSEALADAMAELQWD